MAPNTAPDKPLLEVKTRDGKSVRLRIGVRRDDWHDWLIEVYPPTGWQGIAQISGHDFLCWKKGLRCFLADADVDLDINSYEEWHAMFEAMEQLYFGGKS